MTRKLFFDASLGISDRLAHLFDFLWSAAAGLWNLRWQVDGYIRAVPNATDDELRARFVLGSGIHGSNLRAACVDHTWQSQQEHLAAFLLFNMFSLYEAWADSVLDELHIQASGRELQSLGTVNQANPNGLPALIAKNVITPSTVMSECFYPLLSSHPKNSLKQTNALLICYRYFKECRNCLIHSFGRGTPLASQRSLQYSTLTASDLGLAEVPQFTPVTVGTPIKLSLRGVTGFGDVILRLIATFDAEMARTTFAETLLIERLQQVCNGTIRLPRRNARLVPVRMAEIVTQAGFPRPRKPEMMVSFLRSNGLTT